MLYLISAEMVLRDWHAWINDDKKVESWESSGGGGGGVLKGGGLDFLIEG